MNLLRTLLIGAARAATVGTAALAQASSTVATPASGTIFQPIVLTKTTDLSFGTVVRPATGSGVVTIAASDGARTLTGSGALITGPGFQAASGRATYGVVGEGGQAFSINVPANFNMTRTGGAETIQVTLTPTATTGTLSSTLGTQGTASLGVGGSIPVSNTTATGQYLGSFSVTVQYN